MHMPRKTCDIHNHHLDSTIWDYFNFRPDDIIIASWPKCGTTLMQQIIAQLIFQQDIPIDIKSISPWVDLRIPPRQVKLPPLDAQTHRRFIKSHLPVHALTMSPIAKYIFIARDGRDAVWSLHNHHIKANQLWYNAINESPGRVGPPMPPPNPDILQYFREWLDKDGYPIWSFWETVKSWWEIRHLPNVLFVHYADVIQNKKKVMMQIASFLDIRVEDDKWENILEHCSLGYMRKHGEKIVPGGGAFWHDGAESFVFKGINGRWKDVLTNEDCERYHKISTEKLGEDCARWLTNGGQLPE